MALCVVFEGNPQCGFDIYGPFNNEEEATRWADRACTESWWVLPLVAPDADNKEE